MKQDAVKHVLVMLTVSVLSAYTNLKLWNMVGLPDTGPGKWVWCLMYPLGLAGFSILTGILVYYHKRRRRPLIRNGWFSVGTVPLIALIISADTWGRWSIVLGLYYFIWGALEVYNATLLLAELEHEKIRSWGIAGLYFLIALLITPFFQSRAADISFHTVLSGGLLTAIISIEIYFCLKLISTKPISKTQRMFLIQSAALIFTFLPFLNGLTHPSFLHVSAILALAVLYLMLNPEREGHFIYVILFLLICFPLLTGMAFTGLSIWALLCLIVYAHRHPSPWKNVLESGGIVFFLLVTAVFILYQKGHFPPGDRIWGINIPGIFLAGLLDIEGGVLFAAPMTGIALAGLIFFLRRHHDGYNLTLFSYFILSLFPVTLLGYLSTGACPDLVNFIPFIAFLIPFAAGYESVFEKPFGNALYLLSASLTLMVGAMGFLIWLVMPGSTLTWGGILRWIESFSDLSFVKFFPVFNQLSVSAGRSTGLWLGILLFLGIVLYIEQRFIHREFSILVHEGVFFLLLTLMMFGFYAGTAEIRSWEPVFTGKTVVLSKDKPTISIPCKLNRTVYAIRMVSHLSNAAGLKQGAIVGELTFIGVGGKREHFPIRAGIETAEWAYDRPDVLPIILHKRPETIFNRMETLPDGRSFERHSYIANWFLKKNRIPARLEITLFLPQNAPKMTLTLEFIQVRIRKPTQSWGFPQPLPLAQPIHLDTDRNSIHLPVHLKHSVSQIVIHSNLANTADLTDGVIVAEIQLKDSDNHSLNIVLRSGFDTAEWAYDRKDLIGKVRHSKPDITVSKKEKDEDGFDFLSHIYKTKKVFQVDSFSPVEMTIRYRIPRQMAPFGSITIYTISFL